MEVYAIKPLIGKTIKDAKVDRINDVIEFILDTGDIMMMYHEQDCCESVGIEDICPDIETIVGSPITLAEERFSYGDTNWGTETWTFYEFQTCKGSVTMRWYGESNGFYSEKVDIKWNGDRYVPERCA